MADGTRRGASRGRGIAGSLLVAATMIAACGIGIRRDLSDVPIGRVGYDDLCGLQRYFDQLAAEHLRGPRLVLSVGTEARSGPTGGRDEWLFDTPVTVRALRGLLQRNWSRLPEEIGRARGFALEVEWVERAGVRRVISGKDSTLRFGRSRVALPYHPCLSELLYGTAQYKLRRETIAPRPRPPPRDGSWNIDLPRGGRPPSAPAQ